MTSAIPIAVALTIAALTVPASARAAVNDCPEPISHHGISPVSDSMIGFRAAAARGVGFEADLRTTNDGHVVMMHSARLGATTNGTGLVANKTLAQVERLLLDDGTRVPTLRRVLVFVAGHPETSITMDLKALTRHTQGKVSSAITKFGLRSRTRAISFKSKMLLAFRAANPGVRTALIFTDHAPTVDEVAPYGGAQLAAALASADWVNQMHLAGLEAGLRVTNDPVAWQHGRDWDFDRVLTDDIDGYLSWCAAS